MFWKDVDYWKTIMLKTFRAESLGIREISIVGKSYP